MPRYIGKFGCFSQISVGYDCKAQSRRLLSGMRRLYWKQKKEVKLTSTPKPLEEFIAMEVVGKGLDGLLQHNC